MENQEQIRIQILDEVRQLCSQYAAEVPSKRRTWPKSIKERVLQLLQMEIPCEEIGSRSGIPVATIYSWKMVMKKEPTFLPVQVVPERTNTTSLSI